MKLIVGLGNPGKEYAETRHNVGFMFVDAASHSGWLKNKNGLLSYNWLSPDIELVKPQTFMNKSGDAVAYVFKKHRLKLSDLIVVHDDLDIQFGEYKIQLGKGPKIHNGVNSISAVLGSEAFWRVRIGIENRSPLNKIPGKNYVLGSFSAEEKNKMQALFLQIKLELSQKELL